MKDQPTERLLLARDQLLAVIKLNSSDLAARKRLLDINNELGRRRKEGEALLRIHRPR